MTDILIGRHSYMPSARTGKLRRVALEALGAARRLAGDGGEVHAVLAGGGPAAALAEAAAELAARGAGVVHVIDDPALARFAPEAYAAAIGAAVAAVQPSVIVLGHTAAGRELAPRVAAALHGGHIADVTAIERRRMAAATRSSPARSTPARRSSGCAFFPAHRGLLRYARIICPSRSWYAAGGEGNISALPYTAPPLWTDHPQHRVAKPADGSISPRRTSSSPAAEAFAARRASRRLKQLAAAARRRSRSLARRLRRRLLRLRAANRADRQNRHAKALYRLRHQRRHPASGRA